MSEIQQDEQEQIKQRRSKLNELRESGSIAFPTDFRRNVVAGELLAEYGEKSKEELEAEPVRVKLAGRIMTRSRLALRVNNWLAPSASRAASSPQTQVGVLARIWTSMVAYLLNWFALGVSFRAGAPSGFRPADAPTVGRETSQA